MNGFEKLIINMRDCAWNSITSIQTFSLFSSRATYQAIEDISRLEQAIRDVKRTIEKVNDDLDIINEKINENHQFVEYMYNRLPSENIESKSVTRSSENRDFLELKNLLSLYRILTLSYPTCEDFTKLSAEDLEDFNEHYEEHHELVIKISENLLKHMHFEVLRFQDRFQALSLSLTLTAAKK